MTTSTSPRRAGIFISFGCRNRPALIVMFHYVEAATLHARIYLATPRYIRQGVAPTAEQVREIRALIGSSPKYQARPGATDILSGRRVSLVLIFASPLNEETYEPVEGLIDLAI